MPYRIERNEDGTYRVVNAITGFVKAKHSTKEDAEAQVRIMEDSDRNPRHKWGR